MKNIQSRYEKTKDLQASFTQKTRIEGFSTPVISVTSTSRSPASCGGIISNRPRKKSTSTKTMKMYVPEHKQVLVGKVDLYGGALRGRRCNLQGGG